MGWLADFFRLLGGFLFWNARKSAYRLRGARGRCPCQHPSDSGKAWETGCNAITHWHEPARFRRICPLLQKDTAERWRCSVNQTDVRPFWGRAFAFYGGSLASLYLVATLAAFAFLRTTGYDVTYAGVLWPPAWGKFDGIKSDFFYAKFQRAYAAHDIREALLDLSLAYDLNPRNYEAGLLLAQFCQVGQAGLSNRVYTRLLAEHPDRAEQTSLAFFRALLSRGDFKSVQTLARDRLLASPSSASAWLNAFLFANQRLTAPEALHTLGEDPRVRGLPVDVQTVLALAISIQDAASPDDVRHVLITSTGRGATGYTLYFICRQAISHHFPQIALGLLDQSGTGLNIRDGTALRLDALAAQGWHSTLDQEFDNLLALPLSPAVVELLGTHLIRYPNPKYLGQLCGRLEKKPLPLDEKSYSAYLSLFCAAGVGHDEARLNWSALRLKEILGTRFDNLATVGDFLLGKHRTGHLENFLPALQPLPLETTYALLCRYTPAVTKTRLP